MYPQRDWLGLLACIPDTRLCYNRPFPVAEFGQRSFLLLSHPALLPAQIRLLKENRRPPPAFHFFAPLQTPTPPFCLSHTAAEALLFLHPSDSVSVVMARTCSSPFSKNPFVLPHWKVTQNGCQRKHKTRSRDSRLAL